MKPGYLVKITAKGKLSKIHAIGMYIEPIKDDPDGGWVIMIGNKVESFASTWWTCEVVNE